MKKLLIFLFIATSLLAQGDKKDPPPAPSAPVKADPDFVAKYNEFMTLTKLIERKENSLKDMRQDLQATINELHQWMVQHKIDGWQYDPKTALFTEPPKPKEETKK